MNRSIDPVVRRPWRQAAPGARSDRWAPEGAESDGGEDAAAARRSLRVLLVEDLPRVQKLLHELIVEPGRFEVAGLVETEADAIVQYGALQPEVVIIDLNLRSGTGLGVIMALRRMQREVRPLLIVLTNHALPVLEAACLNAGADYFLDKSRDFHKVRPLLEQAWSNSAVSPHGNLPPGAVTH